MSKTKILIGVSIILLFCGVLYLYAQKPQEEQLELANPEHQALERKFDALALDVRKTNAEVLKKLDQILDNQAKIFQELDVIRIRASHNR